jgi:predicted Rossmann fold flavoprotein
VLADRVLLATGGTKGSAGLPIAESLGHSVAPPVPSLFTFHVDDPRIKGLEGVCAPPAGAVGPGHAPVRDRTGARDALGAQRPGDPQAFRLGGARAPRCRLQVHARLVNWAEPRSAEQARLDLEAEKRRPPAPAGLERESPRLPARLWERLVAAAGVAARRTWATVSNDALRALALQATQSEFAVAGKSMNKEEFVTCGGVRLEEVDMATMESRLRPGLFFAGEVLDIDGITGGLQLPGGLDHRVAGGPGDGRDLRLLNLAVSLDSGEVSIDML